MTGAQAREARKLLGWNVTKLSRQCNLSYGILELFERTGHLCRPMGRSGLFDRLAAIRTALEAAGVMFTDGEEPRVKLRKVDNA